LKMIEDNLRFPEQTFINFWNYGRQEFGRNERIGTEVCYQGIYR